jgi:ubiquinone/menaquinone biosynthesis C-methylase UbiE
MLKPESSRNFGAVACDYANFRVGFPDSLFDRLATSGVGRRGQIVVDLGTGTGALARGFARRGCRVTGVDPDERMLAEARRLDQAEGVATEYRKGVAEAIPLPDRAADAVSAGQCWHWFDAPRASTEIARVVRPGGFVVIANFDWLPLAGTLAEATERLIERHNPRWHLGGGNGFHPESLPHLHAAGFRHFETFSYDVDVPFTPEAWRGRIRSNAGIGASLAAEQVEAFDTDLARLLLERFPGAKLVVPHRVFTAIGRAP